MKKKNKFGKRPGMIIQKRDNPIRSVEKEMSVAERSGYRAIDKRSLKGYLKGYTILPGYNSALLIVHIDLTGEICHFPTMIDLAEAALRDHGKIRPVGVVISDIVYKNGEVVKRDFVWGVYEWNEQFEKAYQEAINQARFLG